ncbi:hypothetical protein WA158_002685 [Blastocystis sp. Blastoise]
MILVLLIEGSLFVFDIYSWNQIFPVIFITFSIVNPIVGFVAAKKRSSNIMFAYWILNMLLVFVYLGNLIYSIILQDQIQIDIRDCKKTGDPSECSLLEEKFLVFLCINVLLGIVPCILNLLGCIWGREAQKINLINEYETLKVTLNMNQPSFARSPY